MRARLRIITMDYRDFVRAQGRLDELRKRSEAMPAAHLTWPLHDSEVRIAWRDDAAMGGELPWAIVGYERSLNDLLPRLMAVPGLPFPISSLTRLWNFEDIRDGRLDGSNVLSPSAELGFIGLIVHELITAHGASSNLNLIGMDRVRQTLSFVCAQAARHGWHSKSLATVVKRWFEVGALLGNSIDTAKSVGVASLCGFVQELPKVSGNGRVDAHTLADCIEDWLFETEAKQPDVLSGSLVSAVSTLSHMSSREERFDFVTNALRAQSPESIRDPLASGFLISLIEPGSFDFEKLARSFGGITGAVSAAYFACASILGGESALRRNGGLGLSIISNGLRGVSDALADISYAEFGVLHNAKRKAPLAYRTASDALVEVELAPLVVGCFNRTAGGGKAPGNSREIVADRKRDDFIRGRLLAALSALDEAYRTIEPDARAMDAHNIRQGKTRR